jgi:geranylgeranyl pyrophosphate synthase
MELSTSLLAARALETTDPLMYKRQSQLGQITEMIHVARYGTVARFDARWGVLMVMCSMSLCSLIHDDVLDEAETRRGDLAVHKLYSNKVGCW